MKERKDLTGKKFGKLTVIKLTDEYKLTSNGVKNRKWLCQCECGNQCSVYEYYLTSGTTKSCGCYRGKTIRKENKYDLTGEYGVGYTTKGEEFYFDLEDYDLIKNFCWFKTKQGYIRTTLNKENKEIANTNSSYIFMHQLLCHCADGQEPDHQNRVKWDNRKSNLKPVTRQGNMRNKPKYKNNIYGVVGIVYRKKDSKWLAWIAVKSKKKQHLGVFNNKEDAIIARLNAEALYYKEQAPQRHLFEQYGITINPAL